MTLVRSFITSAMLVLTIFAAGSFAQNMEMVTSERLDTGKRFDSDAGQTDKTQPGIPGQSGRNSYDLVKGARKTGEPGFVELISATTYAFGSTSAAMEDMSSGTTQLIAASQDDTASAVTSIGFDFWFDGVRQTQFSVNANGLMGLGAVAVNNGATGRTNDFATTTNNPKMSAYWDDMCTGAAGRVHYKVIGSPGSRKLIVEWLNMVQFDNGTVACGISVRGSYQIWLFEGTGIIQTVTSGMVVNDNGNTGYSTGIGSSSTSFASVTTSSNTVSYAASSNANVAALAAGTSYTFTPNVPSAPGVAPVTGITATGLTLNWVDNSSNEVGFVIYRSTDNITFTFLTQTAANATSFADSGLTPSTNYFYTVQAVSEGALSTVAALNATTLGAGNDTCNGAGGLWNTPATWTDGSVPGAGDNVTIGAGCTVTIDTAATALNVTVQNGGILQYEDAVARSLTATGATVDTGGTFQSGVGGTVTTHSLSVSGSLVNNGTLDFSTNTNTAGALITFTGLGNANFTLGGTSTTDLRQTGGVTLNKGTSIANELTFSPGGTLTVLGANTVGFLTLTNGLFTVGGTGAFSNPLFSVAGYAIPATAGLRMNNPNATVVAQNGTGTVTGRYWLSQGNYNVGTGAGSALAFAAGANITIEGGTLTSSGRVAVTASANVITFNMTGGTITTCTVGNTSTTLASFDLGTGAGTTNISGGNIFIVLANTAVSGPRDYRNQSGLTGTTTVTGGTVQFGTAASGAAKAYSAAGVFPNVVVDNTSAGHSVTLLAPAVFNNVTRNITITNGATFNIGSNVFLMNGATLTNNGTLTANGASSNFVWFLTTSPQLYTGTGVATAPITNFAVQADLGLTIDPASANITANAVRLFSGSIINANKLIIGNGGATASTVQIGNTTTPTNAGTFDTNPTFNPGTGGIIFSYLRTTTSRVTGPEVPASRTINNLTRDDNDLTHTLTLAGGNITVIGTLALTNGTVVTSDANTLIHNGPTVTRTTGFVDGPLARSVTVAAYTFHVGEGAYSPVLVNTTAIGTASTLTVEAFNATLAGFNPPTSLSRNWSLTESGDITADLSFTYDVDANDVNGNEADYRVFSRNSANVVTNHCSGGPCVNTGTNTLGPIIGVTTFSRWTGAENQVPTAANASIGGRVTTAGGNGIRNAMVTVSGGDLTAPILVQTGSFGYYQFDGLRVGQTYVVSVMSKRFTFANSTRVIGLQSDITDFDFVAEP